MSTSIWIPSHEGNTIGVRKLFKIPDLVDKAIEKERALKALKVNGIDLSTASLYPIPPPIGSKVKPTIRIKRLRPQLPFEGLRGASAIQNKLKREKEKAEKALKLNSLFG